ncbi:MAG: enoyl-CoA hydratase/isomerase family protein [Rhodoferax sp.]|nr:enoyl-CoA hydratase/isomerase family protein [Rhodoferax sp.]
MSIDLSLDGAVATVTLNIPQRRNALTFALREELHARLQDVARDDNVRAVVLTGAGPSFCSGADVEGMRLGGLVDSRARMRHSHALIRTLYRLEKPVIAAVRGHAVGFGWSLALACDLVIASDTAKFSQIFTRMGLAPDGGAVYFLSRLVGQARAKELVYSARMVAADEALAMGLVNRVVADAELDAQAHRWALELAAAPTFVLAMAKRMFEAGSGPGLDPFLETELLIQPQLKELQDHAEGKQAFKEKREPRFVGH